jgi:hypothetical protein
VDWEGPTASFISSLCSSVMFISGFTDPAACCAASRCARSRSCLSRSRRAFSRLEAPNDGPGTVEPDLSGNLPCIAPEYGLDGNEGCDCAVDAILLAFWVVMVGFRRS